MNGMASKRKPPAGQAESTGDRHKPSKMYRVPMHLAPHAQVTVFSAVDIRLHLYGPDDAQAAGLVAGFQRRCPVYGSLAIASGRIHVEHVTEPLGAVDSR